MLLFLSYRPKKNWNKINRVTCSQVNKFSWNLSLSSFLPSPKQFDKLTLSVGNLKSLAIAKKWKSYWKFMIISSRVWAINATKCWVEFEGYRHLIVKSQRIFFFLFSFFHFTLFQKAIFHSNDFPSFLISLILLFIHSLTLVYILYDNNKRH